MNIIDRATKHFESSQVREIEVPEWQDEKGNATIIYAEAFTLQDRKTLSKFAKDDDIEFLVRLIIMKALTADGKNIFDLSDKPTLMNKVDPDVITRIANEIAKSHDVGQMSGN